MSPAAALGRRNLKIDHLPPHSTDAEKAVLGCVFLASDCIGECIERFKVGVEAFYELPNQIIYATMVQLFESQQAIDVVTVSQSLKNDQKLDSVGGIAYLSTLPDFVPSAANLKYYLDIVWEKYLLRKVVQTCTDLAYRAYECEDDIEGLLDKTEETLIGLTSHRRRGKARTTKELVNVAINKMEQYHEAQGKLLGIATGFADLDNKTMGLQEGDYIVVAARPSVGKTSFAMNIADHVAVNQKLPVGVFTLEMTDEQLMMRMIASRSRVSLRDVQKGHLGEQDFPKLTGAAGKISEAPIHIDETSGLTLMELRSKARAMWQQFGIKLFIIDYLQLMRNDADSPENRQQELTKISNGVKALAKELRVPFLVLSQLNRDVDKRKKNSKPVLSDLRESGAIEQDADTVALMYRPGKHDNEDEERSETETDTIVCDIAKNRNGPIGDFELTFIKKYTRFESVSRVHPDDVPI